MKSINEILKKEGKVFFHVEPHVTNEFLLFAKENGCKWINGREIKIDEDKCGHFMGIDKDMKIGFVSAMCWVHAKDKIKKLEFENIRSKK